MATYFPPCLDAHEYCTLCDTEQFYADACTSGGSRNTTDNKQECEVFCNSQCNSECNEPQTVCIRGPQYISQHPDVGGYNGSTVKPEDFIHEKWSASYWNTLIGKINAAEKIGRLSPHGSAGSVSACIGGEQFQTASLYNQVNTKLCNFNTSYGKVKVEDLITATIANAIGSAYNSATFNSSVCDMCNTDQSPYVKGGCGCNCSCACSCNCGCSCPCHCNCGAPCTCPYNNPTPSTK